MRIAGVRLADARMVWLDVGALEVAPLSHVTVRLAHGDAEGTVFISPERFLSSPPRIDGVVVESRTVVPPNPDCTHLPGSEFPALGDTVRQGDLRGIVIALDPAERRITIAPDTGTPVVVPWDDRVGG